MIPLPEREEETEVRRSQDRVWEMAGVSRWRTRLQESEEDSQVLRKSIPRCRESGRGWQVGGRGEPRRAGTAPERPASGHQARQVKQHK